MNSTLISVSWRRFTRNSWRRFLLSALAGMAAGMANAQTPNSAVVLKIAADQVAAKVSPTLYGLMTEEINYSYEGGLYGELIRNRSFKADAIQQIVHPDAYDPAKNYPAKFPANTAPKFWSTVGGAKIALDTNTPLNGALNVSLRLDLSSAAKNAPAGVANGGYWGIPVKPNTTYHASFYAKAQRFSGPLTVSLESADGKKVFAQAQISGFDAGWKKFNATLTTGGDLTPSKENRLVISTTKPGTWFNHHGTIWLQQVSLMPPTFKNRPNGDRTDISQILDDLQPKFLRFPGGNYVEGDYFNERFNWKETIGPVEQRPGHRSCWGYWSTDGFGLPEYLGWCQDLGMEPVLAVFAGYVLKRDYIPAGPTLAPFVQEALEEIQYVTGDATTHWGAQRVKDGYPNPFKLRYVEIGNEDWFDRSGSYDGRFAQFYDAIKAKYPNLQIIATTKVSSRTPDLVDDHFYRSALQMQSDTHHYDNVSRQGPKIFVGEWATREGSPTPNMNAALGDAAWLTGLERNSDLVVISCYAPLFVNVSPGGMQWRTDLIGYDALTSYASPAYYVQKMFNLNHGDAVLPVTVENLPMRDWQPPAPRRGGVAQTNLPPVQQVPTLFFNATRDTRSGVIFLKVVNAVGSAQNVSVEISGLAGVAANGEAVVLSAASPEDTNSNSEPTKLVPVTTSVDGLGRQFSRTFPPYSVTVLRLKTE